MFEVKFKIKVCQFQKHFCINRTVFLISKRSYMTFRTLTKTAEEISNFPNTCEGYRSLWFN